jgi:NAD(P)-dependent dehydrogenase (short-subunit alcohol dehydrogenase family)
MNKKGVEMCRLKGKVAIITGGGRGIGRGIALRFGQEGAKVVVVDILKNNAEETAQLIKKENGEAIALRGDVSKRFEIDLLVEKTISTFGRIDILVNNAGIGGSKACINTSEDEWDQMLAVNLKSVFLFCKKVIPEMIKLGKGKIINIASIYGIAGSFNTAAYCASKAGIINLTRQLAVDYSPFNIYINSISPGLIKTKMTYSKFENSEKLKQILQFIPLGRPGIPDDIAKAAVFLASEESDFITGHNLVVDGGQSILLT